MSRFCHFKRRKQKFFCRAMVLWIVAVILALLGMSRWRQDFLLTAAVHSPPAHLGNPDASEDWSAPVPRVSGDGVLSTPRTVVKLVPFLASDATRAVENGDAAAMFRQFMSWFTSGEVLRSDAFWLFCSIMALGVFVVACCSLIQRLRARLAAGLDPSPRDPSASPSGNPSSDDQD